MSHIQKKSLARGLSNHIHPDHCKVLNRLKRSEGQVRGIINMIENNRYCVDILVQTRALQASLRAIEAEIMRTHVEGCVKDAIASKNSKVASSKVQELMSLIQRFE